MAHEYKTIFGSGSPSTAFFEFDQQYASYKAERWEDYGEVYVTGLGDGRIVVSKQMCHYVP